MKYINYVFLSILILLVLFIILLVNPVKNQDTLSYNRLQNGHIILITDQFESSFWTQLTAGAKRAADVHEVFVECVAVQADNSKQLADALDRAILANVDGIAIQPTNSDEVLKRIEEARQKGIQIVTYENDILHIESLANIGSNNYQIGYESAKLAVEATDGNAKIGLFLNTNPADDARYKSLKLQGLLEYFADYPNIEIAQTYALDFDPFESDRLTRNLLSEYPEVNLIMCIDERRTPSIAQTIVDLNRVGDVKLIGFGDVNQTIEYVKKEIIYGIVCVDAYEIGYKTVETLQNIMRGKSISAVSATSIYTYTKDNINNYYTRFSDMRDEEENEILQPVEAAQ